MVDCGGKQTFPAMRVIFVRQLPSSQFDIQHPISGQDRPGGEVSDSQSAKPICEIRAFPLDKCNQREDHPVELNFLNV